MQSMKNNYMNYIVQNKKEIQSTYDQAKGEVYKLQ